MKRIIKKFRIDKRIRAGYGSAFVILLFSYLLTLFYNIKADKQTQSVQKTNMVITKFNDFVSLMKDAEISSTRYLLTKQRSTLNPYYQSRNASNSLLYNLDSNITNNPQQKQLMKKAKFLLDKKFSVIDSNIVALQKNNHVLTDSLLANEEYGKTIMDSLRNVITTMQNAEEEILNKNSKDLQRQYRTLNGIITASLIVALLLFILGFITYIAENKARRYSDQKAEEYREQLEKRIDDLDKANKELVEMRRFEKFTATGRIARTIAHEVRNPLTNINLSVDQLKSEQDLGDEDRNIFYDMITRNSQRINLLITELLDSTRFIELKSQTISINKLLDEALVLAEDRIMLNDIQIVKQYGTDICDIKVDEEKVKIAFLNIIVNGIEAMEPGKGVLTIKTYTRQKKCYIEITDNGTGMDAEALGKLFEPYYSRKAKGTGLGLTNTENIILSHKGSINVESILGKGTTFIIVLNLPG
ncbi:MAG: CHASE3 domain-containing protein [Chitinophagaceae bacterium]|nr:CHASE3 domain-containing protein [Chitinophagaceae bacterium]